MKSNANGPRLTARIDQPICASVVFVIALACLITFPVSALIALRPDHWDGSMYLYIGEMWAKGVLPYVQIFDNKPLGIFALTAVASLTHHTLWAVAVLHFIFTIGCILTVRTLLQRCGAPALAVGAGTVLVALLVNLHIYAAGYMSEAFLLWPMSASMLAFVHALRSNKARYVVLAGVCSGIGLFFKPFGASAMMAQVVFTVFYFAPKFRSVLLWILANTIGLIAAWIPAMAYFAVHAGLKEMLYASFLYNARYGFYSQPGTYRALSILLQRLLPVSVTLVCMVYGAASLLKVEPEFELIEAAIWRLALLWFAADLLLVLAAGRGYDQYFLSLTPVLGLIGALFIWRINAAASQARLRGLIVAMVLVPILLAYLQGSGDIFRRTALRVSQPSPEYGVVDQIKKMAKPDSTLLVWGYQPWLFYGTQLRPASRYESTSYVYDSPLSYSRVGGEISESLRTAPPDFIVVLLNVEWNSHWRVESDTFKAGFDKKLRESYEKVWQGEGYLLYRHRS